MKTTELKRCPAALAAIICFITLLAGCKGSVLDYRNATINNGKVYAGDANKPFSGQFTNVPSSVILGSQQGFRNAVATLEKTLPTLTLDYVRAAGIDDFPTDARIPVPVYCDTQANDGYLDGKTICKTAGTDNVVLTMTFANGALNGELDSYAPDDTSHLFAKITFSNGKPDGRMEIYSPVTHRLVHTMTWDNGVLNGDEEGFDENTGNRVLHASLVDGKYGGKVTGYAPDGNRVIYSASFTNGQKQGIEEAFDPTTGKPAGHAEYVDGKLEGTVRRWNADGKLIYEKNYRSGREVEDNDAIKACIDRRYTEFDKATDNEENVNTATRDEWEAACTEEDRVSNMPAMPPSSAAPAESGDTDSCVSNWTTAYRRENGNDAMVTADQMGEWQSWCKAGKRPT